MWGEDWFEIEKDNVERVTESKNIKQKIITKGTSFLFSYIFQIQRMDCLDSLGLHFQRFTFVMSRIVTAVNVKIRTVSPITLKLDQQLVNKFSLHIRNTHGKVAILGRFWVSGSKYNLLEMIKNVACKWTRGLMLILRNSMQKWQWTDGFSLC